MGKTHAIAIAVIGLLLALGWFLMSRALDPERRTAAVEDALGGDTAGSPAQLPRSGVVGGPAAPDDGTRALPESAVVGDNVVYTPEDVRIFDQTMEWARQQRLDTLGMGEIIVRIGRRFVGEPYTPQTLDLPGPERVVINLREFDCVTYIESVLALARMVRDGRSDFDSFPREILAIRYRNGTLDGYTSRLHYFSEWLADNADRGLVEEITGRLDGRTDDERIDFMSRNAEAYPQLGGFPDRIERIREVEERLSRRSREYIPAAEIADVADQIRNGDIIAATSSVEGLDVAHTGFALWQNGELHLMHAPLVGKSLEISDQPLARRILRISGQDGIMVARPL